MNRCRNDAKHLTRLTLLALAFFLASNRAPADYIEQTVSLYSATFGVQIGTVDAAANSNTAGIVNGLLPGQIRLTYTVNPVDAYGSIGPNFGLNLVGFAFQSNSPTPNLKINTSDGWSITSMNGPFFTIQPNNPTDTARTLAVVFSGLGTQASVSDVLHLFSNGDTFPPSPPAPALNGLIGGFETRGKSGLITTDSFAPAGTPEPPSVVMAVVGFCILWVGCRSYACPSHRGSVFLGVINSHALPAN